MFEALLIGRLSPLLWEAVRSVWMLLIFSAFRICNGYVFDPVTPSFDGYGLHVVELAWASCRRTERVWLKADKRSSFKGVWIWWDSWI